MPKSMTGYGRHQFSTTTWNATWEIRSVNSRHLDLRFKTPSFMNAMISGWEKEIKKTALRGKIDIFLAIHITDPQLQSIRLDQPLAQSMLNQLKHIAPSQDWQADVSRFLNVPYVWKEDGLTENKVMQTGLLEGLKQAITAWDKERAREGNELADDLKKRHTFLVSTVEKLQDCSKNLAEEKFAVLQNRVNELLTDNLVPEERMLQELAVLADKLDVSEELTRLRVHLKEIATLFEQPTEVGRKLDFLFQECFREINTCSNKAQNTDVSHLAVTFKAELEKCREQIQNLE